MENNQIAISLIAQLPTCKKGLLDKIRKTLSSSAQGQGWRAQGRRVRASNACGAFSPTDTSLLLHILGL